MSGGFQYKNNKLQFFPHAEGYVNVTDSQGVNNYNYVFNYTDHLGNIRVSYGFDPDTQSLKILEENHYYAFGLKHTNYNSDINLYTKKSSGDIALRRPLPSTPVDPSYKYKYQGQERQTELGLNWDSFKYRNYDPAIGRFMSIDPLTEDYPLWAPYVFSGNRVVDARELEGLEPHVLFDDLSSSVANFGEQYAGYSILKEREIGANFYKVEVSQGVYRYAYTTPVIGMKDGLKIENSNDIPDYAIPGFVAMAHTHGNAYQSIFMFDRETNMPIKQFGKINQVVFNFDKLYEIIDGDNNPSGNDGVKTEEYAKSYENFMYSYTFTPSGLVIKSKVVNGRSVDETHIDLSRTSVSDTNSPLRVNNNSPNPKKKPDVLPVDHEKKVTEQKKQ
ncbi:DUF4329 domain-containing protein [Flavobacterium jejuense]|uniref:DUF4329 domain-containing protein n=1 Tax=Flavobacterium jejuense TaxID=1544455 RepID=A0ABX0IWJ8_9FLAO|nr:RHS repeat-associated core domain-containing protein [Flavobacterium jejuense]NHN28088.1 DUF4329 domain-containing protein [Flavobacterium jejuense]